MSDSPHGIWPDSVITTASLRRYSHFAMNCDWEIAIASHDERFAAQAAAAAFEEVDRLERDLSRFVPHSDIARVNSAAPGVWTRVGPDTFDCLALAAQLSEITRGAFDPTIGSLLARRALSIASPGGDGSLGMRHVALHRLTSSVAIEFSGLALDLGAIGKGYAVDSAADVLRAWGVHAALVHSGQSSLLAIGNPPNATAWTVGVRDPRETSAELGFVELRDQSISGSGTRVKGAHIIDPRTREPATGITAAWAVAPSAAVSDAISTALMILDDSELAALSTLAPGVSGLRIARNSECAMAQPIGEWRWSRS